MNAPSIVRVSLALALVGSGLIVGVAGAVPAGSTQATFSVTNSGSASYRIPIQVPPGIAGLQPQLALQYDSQAARGIAGSGWSLDGIPSIRRCPKTKLQDGSRSGISLTNSDRFCYQGQRLVMVSGQAGKSYGDDGASYRTEVDGFSRIRSYGSVGKGPEYFEVNEKSGLKLLFGKTEDSRLVPAKGESGDTEEPTTVLTWYLSGVEDRHGNKISYSYLSGAAAGVVGPPNPAQIKGETLPHRISYADGAVTLGFDYVADQNPRVMFVAGKRITYTRLLSSITASVGAAPAAGSTGRSGGKTGLSPAPASEAQIVKKYTLAYDFTDLQSAKPLGRLASVTECSSDASSAVCLPPLSFKWDYWAASDGQFSGFKKIGSLPTSNVLNFTTDSGFGQEGADHLRRFADLNRDGRPDLVAFWKDGVYLQSSQATSDELKFEETPVKKATGFARVDGFWEGDGGGGIPNRGYSPRYLIDMNRDGFADIVGFRNLGDNDKPQGSYVAFWSPILGSFDRTAYTPPSLLAGRMDVSCYRDDPSDMVAPRLFADFDDDGRPDVLRLTKYGAYLSLFEDGGVLYGGKFLEPSLVSADMAMDCSRYGNWSPHKQPTFLNDMNGDGYPDLVAVGQEGAYVLFWDPVGQKFSPKQKPLSTDIRGVDNGPGTNVDPIHLLDMNGDEYPDLIQFNSDGIHVALWTGTTFLPRTKWTAELSGSHWSKDADWNPRQLVDMNGDGFPDLVGFDGQGVHVALSNGKDGFALKTTWTTSLFLTTAAQDGSGNWFGKGVDTPRFLMDLDGDGTPELVGFGNKNKGWASTGKAPGQRVAKISDGLGADIVIKYAVAQPFGGVYKHMDQTNAFPQRDAYGPVYVVSGFEKSTGLGANDTRKWSYTYGGRSADYDRGLLGFAWMSSKDEATGIVRRQDFKQTYPFIGWVSKEQTTRAGVTLSEVTHVHGQEELDAAQEYSTNKRWFTFVQSSTEKRQDLKGISLGEKISEFKYEKTGGTQWGDLTKKTVTHQGVHEVQTTLKYKPVNEESWLLGLVEKSVETSSRPGQTISPSSLVEGPQHTLPPTEKPTISVAYSPVEVYVGDFYTVKTSTTNATSLTFNCTGAFVGTGVLVPGLNQSISAKADQRYIGQTECTFTASGAGGSISQRAIQIIKKRPPVPTLSVAYSPVTVEAGKSYQVLSSTTDATDLTFVCTGAYTGAGSLPAGANIKTTALADVRNIGRTSCNFTATGPGGSVSQTAFQIINPPTPIVAYEPNPVLVGSSYTLRTSAPGATSLTYSCSGAFSGQGGLPVGVNQTTMAIAQGEYVGDTSCKFTASYPGGAASTTVVQQIRWPEPELEVSYTPNPIAVGRQYVLTTSTRHVTNLQFSCVGAFVGGGTFATGQNLQYFAVADAKYRGNTDCTFTAVGPGGQKSIVRRQTIY